MKPGSDRNFPIVVRLKPEYRQSVDAIRNLALNVANPGGSGNIQIPLSEVARVSLASGPAMIYREQQERYVPIKFGVRKRDLAGAVREAQEKVAAQVQLPEGYRLEWVGQFRDLTAALERLAFIVPLSIGVILLLLLADFRSLRRHGARRHRHSDGPDRRHFRLGAHRHAIQRVGGDRIRRSFRHRRHGGHHHFIVLQSSHR